MSLIPQTSNPGTELQRTLGMPPGGAKCIPLNLDFAAQTSYTIDYQNMQARNFFDMVQTVWVDNSLSAVVLTIFIPNSQQTLKIPAGVQGYFTVLCPNPIKMTFSSTGGVLCQVTLLNFIVFC